MLFTKCYKCRFMVVYLDDSFWRVVQDIFKKYLNACHFMNFYLFDVQLKPNYSCGSPLFEKLGPLFEIKQLPTPEMLD